MSVDVNWSHPRSVVGAATRVRALANGHVTGLLASAALLAEIVAIWRVVLPYERPPMTPDAAVFQHMGWYLVDGAALYADMWEPKLPLSYETTALLALVTGDDMYALHVASVLVTALAAVAVVVLVGALTRDITGDAMAALVAGLSVLLLPGFHLRPAYGFKAKYFVLFCGLLAVWLYLHGRPFLGGAAAAASVGYWQLGAVFPLILLGMPVHDHDWKAFGRVVGGGALFTAGMLLPVVVQGTWGHMLVQAVIAPFLLPDPASLAQRLYAGVIHFKYGTPLVLVGVVGLAQFMRSEAVRDHWWVLVGAAWFGVVVFFLDFEVGGYTDLIPGMGFVALGIGLLAAMVSPRTRRWLLVAVVAVVTVNVLALGGFGVVFDPVETPEPVPMDDLRVTDDQEVLNSPAIPNDVPDVRYIYWNRIRPDNCHYRFSTNEVRWIELTGGYANGCQGLVETLRVLGYLE